MDYIDKNRIGEYRTKAEAEMAAKRMTRHTGVRHHITETITYRDTQPKKCWTVFIR